MENNTGNQYLDNNSDASSEVDDDFNVHEIVKYGTLLEVKEVIAKDRPRLIALKDKLGRTVLHYAALFDRTKIALFLISKNADINARDYDEATPLHLAAGQGLSDMCRLLLEFKANIRVKDTNCWTPLHHAVDGNHMETATLLVKRGVDLHAEDHKYGRTALHLASEKGYSEMAEMLIIRGASLAASGDAFYSRTPLHLACINGHKETVLVLCQREADVNALSGLLDKMPIHFAIEQGHFEVVKILIQYKANVNAMGKHTNGNSPLHLAAQYNHFNIADHLLKQKDIAINQMGRFTTLGTPLHVACIHGNSHIVHLLLDYGAELNLLDENGHSPLHMACYHEHYDLVSLLIEKHANPSQLSLKKKTPIDYIKNPIIKESMSQLVETMQNLKKQEEEEIAQAKRIQQQRQQILAQQLTLQKQKEFETQLYEEIRRNEFIKQLILICDKSGDVNAFLKLTEEYHDNTKVDINAPLILLSHLNNNPNFRDYRFLPSAVAATATGTGTGEEFQTNHSTLMAHSGGGGGYGLVARGGGGGFDGGYDMEVSSQDSSLASIGSGYSSIFTSNRTHATALTLAALRGFYELVQGILQWPGVNINVQENNGNTALHNAALINSRDICELLLLRGADNRIINKQGKTAANLTTKLSLQEIIRNPKLISQKQHLQDTIIQAIFEKKRKLLLSNNNSSSSVPVEEEKANGSKTIGGKDELTLRDLVSEKRLVAMTKEMVTQTASKGHFSHLPIIASQFNHNIIQQLHEKENPKLDIQRVLAGKGVKSSGAIDAAADAGSSLRFPEIPGVYREEKSSQLERKYGTIPESFGGNRSDFFQIQLYITNNPSHAEVTNPSASSSFSFVDLFHLQKSYLPTSFDVTREWNQVKDFLWLVGYPYRRQMVKVMVPISPLLMQSQSQSQFYHAFPPQHPHHYAALPRMKEEIQEDKRSILYKMAILMNDCQRLFTLSSTQIHYPNEPYFQSEQHFPTSSSSSSITDDENPNRSSTGGEEPLLLSRDFIIETELLQFLQFHNYSLFYYYFLDHPTPKHIPSNADLNKLLLFSNHCFLFLSYCLYFFHPTSITHSIHQYFEWAKEDFYHGHHLPTTTSIAATSSKTQQGYVHSDKQSRPSANREEPKQQSSSASARAAAPPFFEYRLYLLMQYEKEIYQLQSQFPSMGISDGFCQSLLHLLQYSMIQSYESFLQYYNYHFPDQAHLFHQTGFQYHSPHSQHSSLFPNDDDAQNKKDQKKKKKKRKKRKKISTKKTSSQSQVNMLKSIQEGDSGEEEEFEDEVEGEGDDEEEDRLLSYQDPLKQEWSDLIVNPPRSLRAIIDLIFEISAQIQLWLEHLFPNDVVRGHVWLMQATEMMERLIEEEQQKFGLEEQLWQQRQQQIAEEGIRRSSIRSESSGNDFFDPEYDDQERKKPPPSTQSSTALVPLPSMNAQEKDDRSIISVSRNKEPLTSPLQLWLYDLQLLEYEQFFLVNGFKVLEDFQELNHDDCYLYFPFLKIGDLRRLSKHILSLTDQVIEKYKKKAAIK